MNWWCGFKNKEVAINVLILGMLADGFSDFYSLDLWLMDQKLSPTGEKNKTK